ncbi:MAG: serine/threonine protein kinase, partial [Planctomycetota bacterium]
AECSKCRLSYNVSVNAPGSALKCARCGRDLIMVTGYEDMEETEIGGEIREVPLGAAAEEPVASEEVAPPAAAPQPPASEAPTLEMSTPAPAAEAAPAEAPPTAPVPPAAAPPAVAEEVSPEELRKAAPEDVGPQIFGEFSTLGKIGEDSLGILYRGKHVATNQAVTLKVIDLSHTRDKAFVERFVGETKKAAGLSHANMKRVIAAGSDKGHLYYASEFVEGNSVRQLIRSEGRVSIRAATRIVRAVADALRYAHARGVFHGDIRPSYIMVGPDGKVKLAETGVAKNVRETVERFVQQDGVTPFYMAPELATPRCVADTRSDIYELGATYFHMVTGKPPFEGNTPLQILMRMAQEEPPSANVVNPGVPFEVSKVIRKMMAPEFRDRFQTMDQLIQELDQIENLGTIVGAAAVQVASAAAVSAPEPAKAAAPAAAVAAAVAARPAARKDVGGSGLRAARRGVRGSGIRRGVRGRDRDDRDEESRPRPRPTKSSPMLGMLLFVGFLVVAAVVILVLVKANQKAAEERARLLNAPPRAERRVAPTPVQPPRPVAPPTTKAPSPAAPRTKTPTPPPTGKPAFGRSLFGPGGEAWKDAGKEKSSK